MKILNEKLLPLPIVVKILEEESKKRELDNIENVTLEYAKSYSKLSPEAAEKAVQKLVELGLPLEIAVQVVNILPETESELRIILAPLSRTFTTEEVRTILSVIRNVE